MLGCLTDRLMEIDPDAEVTSYGQELNEQTFAIAKADTIIKGGNADNMRLGDTLGNDQFEGYTFDYIISNPPFGIEWKTSKAAVEAEHKRGGAGRFEPGLPAVGDGQMLFLLNGVAKLKDTGRMAIIQNGSSLFKGDAGSGESNIRGYLLEHDWLEAIVQLPNDLFYNTGIATYIWIVTKNKSDERLGQVQLIDASKCFEKRRKPLGNKRVELTTACRELIMQAYHAFTDDTFTATLPDGTDISVESRVKPNDYFKFSKVVINRPQRNDAGDIVLDKKGKPVIDKALKDTEIIPWLTDINAYLEENVRPYAPDFMMSPADTKIGYEIPFTREFYRYTPLRPSADIFQELKELERQESELMEKLLH
jgi:type I restriction enzyme M protein